MKVRVLKPYDTYGVGDTMTIGICLARLMVENGYAEYIIRVDDELHSND